MYISNIIYSVKENIHEFIEIKYMIHQNVIEAKDVTETIDNEKRSSIRKRWNRQVWDTIEQQCRRWWKMVTPLMPPSGPMLSTEETLSNAANGCFFLSFPSFLPFFFFFFFLFSSLIFFLSFLRCFVLFHFFLLLLRFFLPSFSGHWLLGGSPLSLSRDFFCCFYLFIIFLKYILGMLM